MTGALSRYLMEALDLSKAAIASTDGAACSPAQSIAIAKHVARSLAEAGVAPDEPVHVIIGNRVSDLATLLGVWETGAVAVPVHINAALPTVAALAKMTAARFAVDIDNVRVIAQSPPPPRALLAGAALVIFTSGSTGVPKGVVIGHAPFAAKLDVLDRLLQLRASETVLVPLQLTFIFGLWATFLALRRNARVLLMPKFSADRAARALADDVDVVACVPSMLRALLGGPPLAAPRLRSILTGGEPLGAPLARRVREVLPGAAIYDLYGLTETGSCDFCLTPENAPGGFGTVGTPTEGVAFRLLAENGAQAREGEVGELAIKTPFSMFGYLDNPQLTRSAFSEGYFRTGDLARTRGDGRVELVGRSKEIISRGGNKIAPLELDNLLASHPDIAAALCAGVPDERLGEAIHAVVVLRAGAQMTGDALRTWLEGRIERYKIPDAIHIRAALPSGPTGKADRRALARSIEQARERAAAKPCGG